MKDLLMLLLVSALLLSPTAAGQVTPSEQARLDDLQLRSKSTPKETIPEIDNWLAILPAEQLELREKLITIKAFNLMVLSEYDESEQLLNTWLHDMQQLHPELTTRAIEILGAIAMRRGEHGKASQYLQQSLELATRYQQPERMITTRIYSGLQAINTGQYDAAMELFLFAKHLNEHYQFDYLRVNLENNINSLRVRLGDYEEALQSLYASLEDEAFLPADRIFVHMTIARSYLALQQFEQAKPHADLALQGYIERGDPFYISALLNISAQIALKQGQLDQAKNLVLEALAIAEQHQFTLQLTDGYDLLSQIYLEQQAFELAFLAKQQHLNHFKTYQNDVSNKQLVHLRSQIDFLQREYQIGQLEQELEFSALKASHQKRLVWLTASSAVVVIALLLFLMRQQQKKRRQAELFSEQLNASYQQLQQTQQQLVMSEKMAATAGMVAGLAHELNTPLGILTTAVSVVREKLESFAQKVNTGLTKRDFTDYVESCRHCFELSESNLERCSRLVQTFKQLAVQPTESCSQFNLHDLINELSQLLETTMDERNVRIKQYATDRTLLADKQHFQLFLLELINNSIEHGFHDKESGVISIRVTMQNDYWLLHYQDDGKGMADAEQRHLFEPFYTTSRHAGHLGLGLNRVYNLVTLALQGHIQLNRAPSGFSLTCQFPNRWLAPHSEPETR